MNIVLTFSASKQSLVVANYFSESLSWPLYDLTSFYNQKQFDFKNEYDYVIFVFPVYSQNIPSPVKHILKKIKAKYFVLLATYGKMGTGNVLIDAKKIIEGKLVGGAYIPSKHTYKENGEFNEFTKLDKLVKRIKKNGKVEISIPKRSKHIFANLAPAFRSKFNIKLYRNKNCIKCNHCNTICPTNAINNGKVDRKCIRCLKCYFQCPVDGLTVKYSLFLKKYLKKDKVNEILIY